MRAACKGIAGRTGAALRLFRPGGLKPGCMKAYPMPKHGYVWGINKRSNPGGTDVLVGVSCRRITL